MEEARDALALLERPFEIIVVDDGSTDETATVLRNLKPSIPELRVLRSSQNCGQTAAMDAGFHYARGDIIVTLDGDGQNDPADISTLIEGLKEYDVVCGIRTRRADNLIRRASSRIANWVRNRLTGEKITDIGCSLKAFRRDILKRVKLFDGMHRFLPTLLRMEGARVIEVPVNHRPRIKGKSKYNIRNRLFRSFRDLLAVRWMQSRRLDYEVREIIE